MTIADWIAGCYAMLGLAMFALVIVRWRTRRYFAAAVTLLWALLAWRLAVRYLELFAGRDLRILGDLFSNMILIAVQVFSLFAVVVFQLIVERDESDAS